MRSFGRRHEHPAVILVGAALLTAALLLSLTMGSAAQLEVRVAAPLQVFVVEDVEFVEADPEGVG